MIKEILNVLQVPISASVFGHLAPLTVFLTAAPGAETHVLRNHLLSDDPEKCYKASK